MAQVKTVVLNVRFELGERVYHASAKTHGYVNAYIYRGSTVEYEITMHDDGFEWIAICPADHLTSADKGATDEGSARHG